MNTPREWTTLTQWSRLGLSNSPELLELQVCHANGAYPDIWKPGVREFRGGRFRGVFEVVHFRDARAFDEVKDAMVIQTNLVNSMAVI